MLFSGTGGMSWTERLEPRLGIDLVGGTRVTLRATTEQGAPSPDQLERAREIIESRVNALGVEEAEVVSEGGDRIVVTVAGEPENALNHVGAPAELRFRKVLERASGTGVAPETTLTPTPDPSASPDPEASASPDPSTSPEAEEASPAPSEEADSEAGEDGGEGGELSALQDPTPTPEPSESPSPSPEPEAAGGEYGTVEERQARVRDKISDEAMAAALRLLDPASTEEEVDQQEQLELLREFEELTGPEVAVLPAKLQFYVPTISCAQLNDRPPGSIQDPDELAVACDETGLEKYLLDVAKVLGTDVDDASGVIPPGTNRWQVNISFTGGGQPKWTDLTREATQNATGTPFDPAQLTMNVVTDEETGEWSFDTSPEAAEQNNRYQGHSASEPGPNIACGQQTLGDDGNCLVATVLDNVIVSAPEIQSVIPGDATIFGDFNSESANLLASQLRFGALPVTFEAQEGQSITATLGVEYLRAGLLAAAIGFGLVLLYSFFYYRLLGIVIFGSLIVSALLTYAALVVLGRSIGFTLTLAGISGFIVAVGIAADSFVIYFERLKDEIREGRTARSAVPRAWHRARRTIITANVVTLLAAVVLYLLSAGQVRGFAFALGLSTMLDLLIVFTFRHPIMTLLARTRAFLSPTISGLGRALELDRARGIRPRSTREAEA
ncbi:MAG TPA: SecD/SecF family protein translocase subunit [Natronosporangium sp.]